MFWLWYWIMQEWIQDKHQNIMTTCLILILEIWCQWGRRTRYRLHCSISTRATRYFGKWKNILCEIHCPYFWIHNKIIILSATMWATALRFSKSATRIHTMFRIFTLGYFLCCLTKPYFDKIKKRKHHNYWRNRRWLSICCVQWDNASNKAPATRTHLHSKYNMLLLVRELAQRPMISIHTPKIPNVICKAISLPLYVG